jgi:hypothetical protein
MKLLRNCLTWVIVPSLALLLCGCPYESEFPLRADDDDVETDEELVGVWKCQHPEEGASWTVTIYAFNEREYLIVSQERENQFDLLRASATHIEGQKFLSIRDITRPDDPEPWLIVNYTISGEELLVRMVDEKLFEKRMDSPANLRKFIGENLDNSALYEEDANVVFKRAAEPSED